MNVTRCHRCGRLRPTATLGDGDPVRQIPFPPFDDAAAAWASFDGRTVCPGCQTPAEKREAAHRTVWMILREVRRRQDRGLPPDPYEAALVAYAMATRDQADAAYLGAEEKLTTQRVAARPAEQFRTNPPRTSSFVSPREEPSPAPASDFELDVAFTGAFLTGHPITVRADNYAEFQQKLAGELNWPDSPMNSQTTREGTFETPGGGGFAKALPLVVACRDGVHLVPMLAHALDDPSANEVSPLELYPPLVIAQPKRLRIDVYDLGVAVITAWFRVAAATGADYADTARAVKELSWIRSDDCRRSPVAAVLKTIACNTAVGYGRAVSATSVGPAPRRRRTTQAPARDIMQGPPNERGRLLWLHPINVLNLSSPTARNATAKRAVKALAPPIRERVDLAGGTFAPGIGSSAVVVADDTNAAAMPIRLTQLHWAYHALYMQIDRGLLEILNEEQWGESQALRSLEIDADKVFAYYKRVTDARARLDTDLINLGGDEIAVWEKISKVQRFETIVDAVERKLIVLEQVAQRRVAQAIESRARLISRILGFITLLTLVTGTGAIIGLLLGARPYDDKASDPRVWLVVGASGVAVVAYWLTFHWSRRLPGWPTRRSRRVTLHGSQDGTARGDE